MSVQGQLTEQFLDLSTDEQEIVLLLRKYTNLKNTALALSSGHAPVTLTTDKEASHD